MKTYTLILYSLVTVSSVSAQEVISTQGETYSNVNANIDFTIGEVVIHTGSDGIYDLTQGFHQTSWNFVGLEDFTPTYEAVVFPNPTEDVLNIKATVFQNVTYTLYDSQGKVILKNALTAEQTLVQVSQLAAGSYSLTLNNALENLKTFKLIKTK